MDFAEQQREAASIRSDIRKAHNIVQDAKSRYIKAKLKARSKKQAEEATNLFKDLAEYENKEAIQNYYGYGDITSDEYDRLTTLWDEREHFNAESRQYKDRVIEMLDKVMSRLGDDYQEFLYDADYMAREDDRNQEGRFPKAEGV